MSDLNDPFDDFWFGAKMEEMQKHFNLPPEFKALRAQFEKERELKKKKKAIELELSQGHKQTFLENLEEFKTDPQTMGRFLEIAFKHQHKALFQLVLSHAPKGVVRDFFWMEVATEKSPSWLGWLMAHEGVPQNLSLVSIFASANLGTTHKAQLRAVERLIAYASPSSGLRSALFMDSDEWFEVYLNKSLKEGENLCELLCHTADQGKLHHLEQFLKHPLSNVDIASALSHAILRFKKKPESIKALVSAFKPPSPADENEDHAYLFKKALQDAATYGCLEALQALYPMCKQEAHINACCSAAQFGQEACFDWLWDKLKDTPEVFKANEREPLTSAVYGNHPKLVRKILSILNTAPFVDKALKEGAMQLSSPILLRMLLSRATLPLNEADTLRSCAFFNKVDLVKELIPVSEPKGFQHAIFHALNQGKLESLQVLWEAADKNLWSEDELSALLSPERLDNVKRAAKSWSRDIDHTNVVNYMTSQLEKEHLDRSLKDSATQKSKLRL